MPRQRLAALGNRKNLHRNFPIENPTYLLALPPAMSPATLSGSVDIRLESRFKIGCASDQGRLQNLEIQMWTRPEPAPGDAVERILTENFVMKILATGCVLVSMVISTAALGRGGGGGMGGMGMHHSSSTGGAFGTSLGTPGTNSSGTALSSGGIGGGAVRGPALGTGDPAVDREDQKAARMVQSICKGC